MRRVLYILLLPLTACAASGSISLGPVGTVIAAGASVLDRNHINLTLLNQCTSKIEVISLHTGFKPNEQIAPYGSVWRHKLYAGGENQYVEVTIRVSIGGRLHSITRQFYWRQEEDVTWVIGHSQGAGYHDIFTDSHGNNICR